MLETPTFDKFVQTYRAGKNQTVSVTRISDMETPVSAMLKLGQNKPYSFLLESVEGGETRGRYSIIGRDPDLLWRCRGDRPEINRHPNLDKDRFSAEPKGSFESFRRLLAESRIELPAHLPPMAAGLVGYFSYDIVRLIECLPHENP